MANAFLDSSISLSFYKRKKRTMSNSEGNGFNLSNGNGWSDSIVYSVITFINANINFVRLQVGARPFLGRATYIYE